MFLKEQDKVAIEAMTGDILAALSELAVEAEEKVPESGVFQKVRRDFEDKAGTLEIRYWWICVNGVSGFKDADVDKRYVEVGGYLGGGYATTTALAQGTKAECIGKLRSPEFVKEVKDWIRHSLEWLD